MTVIAAVPEFVDVTLSKRPSDENVTTGSAVSDGLCTICGTVCETNEYSISKMTRPDDTPISNFLILAMSRDFHQLALILELAQLFVICLKRKNASAVYS